MRSLQWYKRGAAYILKLKSGEEWRKLFTRTNSLDTNTYAIFVKSEECF